ncbi:MAG: MBL fold metallo-hydrolase [Candidatus Colwellbacteria bacterium]|nr:MBL fold metallo-hydrolase [Candidatus Colwellbacteria bacterium]
MKITKFGHCCLLVETKGLRILTDPGSYSVSQNDVKDIDIILITHDHADHLHTESLQEILKNNSEARVITNSGVGEKLRKLGIEHSLLEGEASEMVNDVLIEAFDGKHEEIYGDFGQVQNTGYFIDNKLFYPGDSFFDPEKEVDTLALPVAGPWCTIQDAVNYALRVKPKKALPVHDGMMYGDRRGATRAVPTKFLGENGIEFIDMNEGDTKEF